MALAFEVACDPRMVCYKLRKFTRGEGWGSSIDTQEHREGNSPFFFDYKGRRIWFRYTREDSEPTYRVLPARPHEPMVEARFHWGGDATIVCHLDNSTLTIDLVDGVSFCPRLDPNPKMIEAVFSCSLAVRSTGGTVACNETCTCALPQRTSTRNTPCLLTRPM